MEKHCDHNIPETKKGAGPCDIKWEVKKRNGQPNWWCRTHGLQASAPDGAALPSCSGAWFDAVPDEMQLDLDLAVGEVAIWGVVPPAIQLGAVPADHGKVHVHRRHEANGHKDIDRSFDIVRVRFHGTSETIEGMAAHTYALSELCGTTVEPLACPHCGEVHIDELMFATHPHVKHLCNSCGRNFRWPTPSISNPLGAAQSRLGLPAPPVAREITRPLTISSTDFAGIAIWPSNSAIITTMSRAEDVGVHVHAWSASGNVVLDDTFSPVILDEQLIDQRLLRILAVQRTLSSTDNTPIVSLACIKCGHLITSPTQGWMQATTRHACDSCGTENKTGRRSFVNPLVHKPI